MADTPQGGTPPNPSPPGTGGEPPATSTEVKFAGKYTSPEALEQGFNELRGTLGLEKIDKDLVGDKGIYRDHVSLERAYKDLQTIQSRGKPPADSKPGDKPPAKPDGDLSVDKPPATPPDDADLEVGVIIERAGLKLADLETQFQANNKLTPEQYAAIRKADPSLANVKENVLRAMVDQAARGMILEARTVSQAREAIHSKLAKKLGVEPAQLRATLITMGASVPAEHRAALNRALNDPELAELAVDKIAAFHRTATGSDGSNPIISGDGGNGSPSGIRSFKDLAEAQRRSEEGDTGARRAIAAMKPEDIMQMGRF